MSRAESADVARALAQAGRGLQDKIIGLEQPWDGWRVRLDDLPRPLVFSNGVFDLLHRGHVECLAAARKLGASLVVGLNSDASAKRLGKGSDRPLHRAEDRALMLAALASTDLVLVFDEDTPVALLKTIRPDVYVKGGDYAMEDLEETRWMRSWGGQSLAIPLIPGYSTTALAEEIRRGTPGLK